VTDSKPETTPPRPIVTRERAKRWGSKRYFTGEPCWHGHICERYVKRAWCVECARLGKKPETRVTKKYLAKEPCKRGHFERYASGNCIECTKEGFKKWQAADNARKAAYHAKISSLTGAVSPRFSPLSGSPMKETLAGEGD
jgi:hypothetical protein